MVTLASALALKLAKVRSIAGNEDPGAWLRRRYIDEKASYRELSGELGYAKGGPRGVRSMLEHFGIPIRHGTEAAIVQWQNNPERREAFGQRSRAQRLTHGESKPRTPEYKTWKSMNERCGNPKHRAYASYGGRGIKVCERWSSFENFLADMGRRPAGHQIERKNNDRGYEPENCVWATRKANTRNRRCARTVELDGKKVHLLEACERFGVTPSTVISRVERGWSLEQALRTPPLAPGARRPR